MSEVRASLHFQGIRCVDLILTFDLKGYHPLTLKDNLDLKFKPLTSFRSWVISTDGTNRQARLTTWSQQTSNLLHQLLMTWSTFSLILGFLELVFNELGAQAGQTDKLGRMHNAASWWEDRIKTGRPKKEVPFTASGEIINFSDDYFPFLFFFCACALHYAPFSTLLQSLTLIQQLRSWIWRISGHKNTSRAGAAEGSKN